MRTAALVASTTTLLLAACSGSGEGAVGPQARSDAGGHVAPCDLLPSDLARTVVPSADEPTAGRWTCSYTSGSKRVTLAISSAGDSVDTFRQVRAIHERKGDEVETIAAGDLAFVATDRQAPRDSRVYLVVDDLEITIYVIGSTSFGPTDAEVLAASVAINVRDR